MQVRETSRHAHREAKQAIRSSTVGTAIDFSCIGANFQILTKISSKIALLLLSYFHFNLPFYLLKLAASNSSFQPNPVVLLTQRLSMRMSPSSAYIVSFATA